MSESRKNLYPPLYNVMTKILEEAFVKSGMTPLNTRHQLSQSSSMDEIREVHQCVHGGKSSMKAMIQTKEPIRKPDYSVPPTFHPVKKCIGEKRKERFLKEKQAKEKMNNNYITDLSNLPSDQKHTPPAFRKYRIEEIQEEIRQLNKQKPEDVVPLVNDVQFVPSTMCTCGENTIFIRCRMCGVVDESKCFVHQADGVKAILCNNPKCGGLNITVWKNF